METKTPEDVERGKDTKTVLPRRGSIELRKLNNEPNDAVRDSDPRDRSPAYQRPEVIYAAEKSGTWMSCLKYALFAFNAVIWLLGVAILGVGIWLKADPDFWTLQLNLDVQQFSYAAVVAIVVGVVILLIGFIGCCGAIRESICLLSTFFVILVILVILEAAAMGIVWSMVNDKEFQDKVSIKIRKGIADHEGNKDVDNFLAILQSKLECCGVRGADEYTEFPRSCTNRETGLPFEKGCMTVLIDYLKSKASILGGVCIITLLLQIGAKVFTMCLVCGLRQAEKQIF